MEKDEYTILVILFYERYSGKISSQFKKYSDPDFYFITWFFSNKKPNIVSKIKFFEAQRFKKQICESK